jgi:hypothetical protein
MPDHDNEFVEFVESTGASLQLLAYLACGIPKTPVRLPVSVPQGGCTRSKRREPAGVRVGYVGPTPQVRDNAGDEHKLTYAPKCWPGWMHGDILAIRIR